MKHWNVYQTPLVGERYREINAKGWGGTDWDAAYLKLSMLDRDKEDVWDRVQEAAKKSLYRHTWIVRCPNVDAVHAKTNWIHGSDDSFIRWSDTENRMSCSVGDVVISTDHKEAFVCTIFGWKELTMLQLREFETIVSTYIPDLAEVW